MPALKIASINAPSAVGTPAEVHGLVLQMGEVVSVESKQSCGIATGGNEPLVCSAEGLLYPLVVGDRVLLARTEESVPPTVLAILSPHPNAPLVSRPVVLASQQRIELSTSHSTFVLSADGLARLVGQRIEHEARDAVIIEAGEIRLN